MSSSSLKNELADHIYQYLCHEAQYSDLSEAARESLTAASECIEQAYKLNNNIKQQQQQQQQSMDSTTGFQMATNILPDELLRIFTRHKDFLAQQKESYSSSKQLQYSLRNENESSLKDEKPDIRVNSNPLGATTTTTTPATPTTTSTTVTNDSHNTNNNPISSNSANQNTPNLQTSGSGGGGGGGGGGGTASVSSSSGQKEQQNQLQPQQQQSTKQHSQHTISQLPMTTRKKLSHLRAQIKRQASKAARSRLEKRSSVSGVTSTSGGSLAGQHQLGSLLHSSLDASSLINSKQAGDGFNLRDTTGSQANSSSNDSPNIYLNNPSTSSPVSGPTGQGGSVQAEGSNPNSGGSSSGQHHNEGSSTGGIKLSHLIPDGSDFDSEEQYREALERELMKATAGRGSRAIEELLEEEIEVEGDSGSEPEDWDNISESSTPKPSLRPFFSSTTLDKI